MALSISLIIAAYLLGSVACAILVCRIFGLPDPRTLGSGNPGATNVLRLGGKKAAALTLAGDVAKGLVPVLAAKALQQPEWVVGGTALAAFLGHLFPIYFRFQGGKGVATAFGAVTGLSALTLVGMGLTWLLVAWRTRYSSAASLSAGALAPVYAWSATGHVAYVIATGAIAIFMIGRHRGNIARLLAGTESRIGDKAKKAVMPEVSGAPDGTD